VPSEEALNPRRHLPTALLTTIAAVTVLYVLIQIVAQGTLPELASSKTPLASAARAVMGPPGGLLLTAAAVVATLGSISAVILVGPRILYAFARHSQMPGVLARVHPRYRSPYVAIVVFSALIWVIALFLDFARLATLSAVSRLVFSASTCLAVPVLRWRQRDAAPGFVLPGGPTIPLLAVALSAWLLSGLQRTQAIAGGLGVASGLAIYAIMATAAAVRRRR